MTGVFFGGVKGGESQFAANILSVPYLLLVLENLWNMNSDSDNSFYFIV